MNKVYFYETIFSTKPFVLFANDDEQALEEVKIKYGSCLEGVTKIFTADHSETAYQLNPNCNAKNLVNDDKVIIRKIWSEF